MKKRIPISPCFCNMYNDDNNSTSGSLSNLVACHHCADELREIRI